MQTSYKGKMNSKLKKIILQYKMIDEKRCVEILEQPEWNDEFAILAATLMWQETLYDEYYDCVSRGLAYNPRNDELYLMLGNYYQLRNKSQAWLRYENAELYCKDEDDLKVILEYKKTVEDNNVKATSFVILSYNSWQITKQCIDSIRNTMKPGTYEIIIVDNNSTDGTMEYLKQENEVKKIFNAENKGFPYGCNQGIKAADPENDIMLLNNDTIVSINAIFWLRMGLYEQENIGATGSVTNFAGNGQMVINNLDTIEDYIVYAERNNIPKRNAVSAT